MPHFPLQLSDTIANVRDYGAVGDGVTDDTTAIQAAIDAAAGRFGVCYFPPSHTAYMFSNLKLPGYVTLQGVHMSQCVLKRLASATGPAIREKTAAEAGNTYGASGIWIRDLSVNGNATSGDGIYLGDQVGAAEFNFNAGLQSVFVNNFTSGAGIKLHANAISCHYVWANSNQTGFYLSAGGGNAFHSIWAEANTLYDVRIAGQGSMFYGIQTEPVASTNPSILVEGLDNLISGAYIGLGGNKTGTGAVITNAVGADRNVYRDILCVPGGYTFGHVIYPAAWPGNGTGSTNFHIAEFVIDQANSVARHYMNNSTGRMDTKIGDITKIGGGLAIRTKAGVPSDSDFASPVSGVMCIDTTNSDLYVRVGTTWKKVAVA